MLGKIVDIDIYFGSSLLEGVEILTRLKYVCRCGGEEARTCLTCQKNINGCLSAYLLIYDVPCSTVPETARKTNNSSFR